MKVEEQVTIVNSITSNSIMEKLQNHLYYQFILKNKVENRHKEEFEKF